MTVIFAVTFVMSAVLICKWTLSHYDDDDDDDDDDEDDDDDDDDDESGGLQSPQPLWLVRLCVIRN